MLELTSQQKEDDHQIFTGLCVDFCYISIFELEKYRIALCFAVVTYWDL